MHEEHTSLENKSNDSGREFAKLFFLKLDRNNVGAEYYDQVLEHLKRNNSKHVRPVDQFIPPRGEYAFYKVMTIGGKGVGDLRTFGFESYRYTRVKENGVPQDVQIYEFSYFQPKAHKTEQRGNQRNFSR